MSSLTLEKFLRDRLAEREAAEHQRFRDTRRHGDPCLVCRHPTESVGTGLSGGLQFGPCGHEVPTAEYRAAYGEDAADPFVLVDVASKRRLIDLHSGVVLRGGGGSKYYETTTVCRSCEPPQFAEHAWPCPTLKVLALPYWDHLLYDENWKP